MQDGRVTGGETGFPLFEPMLRPVFAYGSNMDPEQMARRCPGHTPLGPALLLDHELCFPRRSPVRECATASVRPRPGFRVWGVVYLLAEHELAALDLREGYYPERPRDACRYVREAVTVRIEGEEDRPMEADLYVAIPEARPGLPSASYIDHLIAGARHHGLPPEYVAEIEAIETEPDAAPRIRMS